MNAFCVAAILAVVVHGYEFSLINKIQNEPHLLQGLKTTSVEFSYTRFYSIPDLGEASASICVPYKKGSGALSISSLSLDSIYREMNVSGGVGCGLSRVAGGASFSYQVKDLGGDEEYVCKRFRLSASVNVVRNCQLFCSFPSIEQDWSTGIVFKHDTLRMLVSVSLSHSVNDEFSAHIFQSWKIGNNVLLYGTVDSEPLKFCLGISLLCRKVGAGADHSVFPGIGTVQSFYTRYGSAGGWESFSSGR